MGFKINAEPAKNSNGERVDRGRDSRDSYRERDRDSYRQNDRDAPVFRLVIGNLPGK